MNEHEYKSRFPGRKAFLRTSIAPFAAAIIGLFALASAQASTGKNFYDYLEQGYREVATYAVTHAGDADLGKHFTGKAQLAANERTVAPDMPMTAALPKSVRDEMMAARARLAAALAAGAQESEPLEAAVAQVNLDCWLAQFKGGAQSGSEDCRRLFYVAIAKLPAPPETLSLRPDDAVSTDGAQLSAAGEAPISAVGDPANGTSPGIVGGAIAAVGGPLERLGAAADGAVASANGSAGSTLDGTSNTASDTAGSVIGGATDTVGGTLGTASDTVGGVLGGVGNAAGGALGGAGDAAGGATGGGAASGGTASGGTAGGGGVLGGGGGGLLGGGGGGGLLGGGGG